MVDLLRSMTGGARDRSASQNVCMFLLVRPCDAAGWQDSLVALKDLPGI